MLEYMRKRGEIPYKDYNSAIDLTKSMNWDPNKESKKSSFDRYQEKTDTLINTYDQLN